MDTAQARKQVASLSLTEHLPEALRPRVVDLILEVADMETVADGTVLLREGEIGARSGYVLLEGAAQIDRLDETPLVIPAPALLGEMYQFNPHAQRTATVAVQGQAVLLRFLWRDLYDAAKRTLEEKDQGALMDSIERLVLERFQRETVMDLPLFRGLSDSLKLRASLVMQWVAQPLELEDGAVLFAEGDPCSDTANVLCKGVVTMQRGGAQAERTAPDILGVFPKFDPQLCWSATATAKGPAEILRFPWSAYTRMLGQRLSKEASEAFGRTITAATELLFIH